ncbi:uncharacterized protein LOC144712762 [Wolffia australiana]
MEQSTFEEAKAAVKGRPKVRIVHLAAPRIIQTDVEKFREVVQRLTGKQSRARERKTEAEAALGTSNRSEAFSGEWSPPPPEKKLKRAEEESLSGLLDNYGTFSDFGVIDAFFQDMRETLPFPLSSTAVDVFSEGSVCA